jgi:hypothetical protein
MGEATRAMVTALAVGIAGCPDPKGLECRESVLGDKDGETGHMLCNSTGEA